MAEPKAANSLKEIADLAKKGGPQRIKVGDIEMIIIPGVSDEVLEQMEFFLEDFLDKKDESLRKEISRARKEINQGKFATHEQTWKNLS
jgi:hypothetical protein